MWRIVIRFFPALFRCERVAYKYLVPIIEERLKQMKEPYGQAKKPVYAFLIGLICQMDVLQWLLDSAEGIETDIVMLVSRVLILNFGAILTTSMVPSVRWNYSY